MFYFLRLSYNEINNLSINESLIIMNKLKWYRIFFENKILYVLLRIVNRFLNSFKIFFELFEKRKLYFNDIIV